MLTREEPALLLGRLVALGLAVLSMKRVKMHVAEIDAIAAWRDKGVNFAAYLARVEWATLTAENTVAELRLPSFFQPFHRYQINGQKRAIGAKRDEKGRYLKGDKRKPTKLYRTFVVNADGDCAPVKRPT